MLNFLEKGFLESIVLELVWNAFSVLRDKSDKNQG